jgi:hypothetical protein
MGRGVHHGRATSARRSARPLRRRRPTRHRVLPDAEAWNDQYRIVATTEKFENQADNPSATPDCQWSCNESQSTEWYIVEHHAAVGAKAGPFDKAKVGPFDKM